MVKKVALGLAVAVALLLAVIAAQPSEYTVVRSRVIPAPPGVAYAEVNDFKRWVAWSPWEKLEPNVQHTYTEPSSGLNAATTWKGEQTGEGAMKIVLAEPPERLDIQLDFLKPFPSSSLVIFEFMPEGKSTKVTWTMKGTNDFMGKAFGLFVNMDKMLGKDFDDGLAGLEQACAAQLAAKARAVAAEERGPRADQPEPEAAPAP